MAGSAVDRAYVRQLERTTAPLEMLDLTEDRDDPTSTLIRIRALNELGRFAESAAMADRARTRYPDEPAFLAAWILMEAVAERMEVDEATNRLLEVAAVDREHATSHRLAAAALKARVSRGPEGTRSSLEELATAALARIAEDPEDWVARVNLALVEAGSDRRRARETIRLSRIDDVYPPRPAILEAAAALEGELGNWQEAKALLERHATLTGTSFGRRRFMEWRFGGVLSGLAAGIGVAGALTRSAILYVVLLPLLILLGEPHLRNALNRSRPRGARMVSVAWLLFVVGTATWLASWILFQDGGQFTS